jgi:hypothetical protein
MKKVELEELVTKLKHDNERLQKEVDNYKGSSRQLELGNAVATIIHYTLNEAETQLDIYGNIIDALRDFEKENDSFIDSNEDNYSSS